MKLKDIWHVGCLFSTTLVKEVVIDFKDIFWDPTNHPRPFIRGLKRGPGGKNFEAFQRKGPGGPVGSHKMSLKTIKIS